MSEQPPATPENQPVPEYKSVLYRSCGDVVKEPLTDPDETYEVREGYCPIHLNQD